MANRTIQQKILKMKRRGRYAVLSGATSKYATRMGPTPFEEDAEGKTKTLPTVRILVGEISLSKQVINTGRGPDQERMAEYYNRLRTFGQEIPKTRQPLVSEPFREMYARYEQIVSEQKEMRISLVDDINGRLDLFFASGGHQWFFVDIDYRKRIFRRSRDYGSKAFAMGRLKNKMVTWVETISPKKTT